MAVTDRSLALVGVGALLAPHLLPWFTLPAGQVYLATAFGFVVGVLSGGLGMGGVWLMVPSMKFLFGIDIKLAIGTALTAQVLITLAGSYEHLREKAVGHRVAKPLIVGGIIGTPVGVWLNAIAPSTFLNWAYTLLLGTVGAKMVIEMRKDGGGAEQTEGRELSKEVVGDSIEDVEDRAAEEVEKLGKAGENLKKQFPRKIENEYHGDGYRVDTITLLAAGVVFGIVNALLGTSTTIMVPFLDVFMHLDIHVATAVSLLNVTAISIPASLNHLLVDNVSINLAAYIAGAGILGALAGSKINERAPQQKIQYVLLVLIAVMAYYMLPLKPV